MSETIYACRDGKWYRVERIGNTRSRGDRCYLVNRKGLKVREVPCHPDPAWRGTVNDVTFSSSLPDGVELDQ
jgi:hypothetical protein